MATESLPTTACDPSLEEEIKARIREECADLFDDHISALFNDREAIKQSMLSFLMKEQVNILSRVLGMEPDPFNHGQLRFSSNHSNQLVGSLVPLQQLATQAVDEWVKNLDQTKLQAQINRAMGAAEKRIIEQIINNIDYDMRQRVRARLDVLMDKEATRIAAEMFGNFAVVRSNEHERRRAREALAHKRRETARLKRLEAQGISVPS